MSVELPMPEYLTFSEVQERWNCGEGELKKLILGRRLVASYFFYSEVAKIVKRFYPEDHDGTTVWIPESVEREKHEENTDLPPYKLVWVNGFHYLVCPSQLGPVTGWFSFLSPSRDFREDVGGECYWYSPKSKPGGLSMEDVIAGGALMLSEVERFERLLKGGESSVAPFAGNQEMRPVSTTAHREKGILEAIRELGYDPRCLPQREPGKAWVKSAVWKKLSPMGGVYVSKRAFEKAWESLRLNEEIVESGKTE